MGMSYFGLILISFCLEVCCCEGDGVEEYPLQAPSLQESERVRPRISAEVQAILSGAGQYSCNGSPGWRIEGSLSQHG